MNKLTVLLLDITHVKAGVAAASTIPLGIGMIGSYLKSRFGDQIEITLCKYPDKAAYYLKHNRYDVTAFSNYVWNLNLGCRIAEYARAVNPDTVIVAGGPNYPDDPRKQAAFLKERSVIDFYIYKEAEIAFGDLITSLVNNNWDKEKTRLSKITGCHHYHDFFEGGEAVPRITDMDSIPSPYTSGMLDVYLDEELIPLIQTNRGCPFSCTYCSEGGGYHNRIARHSVERVSEDLEYIGKRYKGPQSLFIADSNFAMYKRDVAICQIIAEVQSKYQWPQYINVATGKNQKKRVIECAEIISGALRLGASVQTTDMNVAKNIKRANLSIDEIISVGQSAGLTGANTYSEIILALPGETKESHFNSIRDVIKAGLNFIRCYTLMLLPAAEIATDESREQFGIVSRYRILPRCFGTYEIDDKTIEAAEIEEVCIATNTMSFDDYVECRLFHLTIELFYNDRLFTELFAFADSKNIDIPDLLELIHTSAIHDTKINKLYSMFSEDTGNELWESREELLDNFTRNRNKYLSGEMGANLIFKYKTLGLCDYLIEMHDIAFKSVRELVNKSGLSIVEEEYLDDLKTHCIAKKADLFSNGEKLKRTLRFDMIAAEKHTFNIDPAKLMKRDFCNITYYHTSEQREALEKQLKQFGTDIIGKARIFANIKVVDLYRKFDYDSC